MEYLPYVFGFTRLFLGITILVKVFEVFGDNKPNSIFNKKPGLLTAAAIFLIGSGLYTIFFSDVDTYKIGKAQQEWSEIDRGTLNQTCLRDTKTLAIEHPQASKEYCACSVDKIIANISKEQYLEGLKKPISEQASLQLKYFKGCLTLLELRVKKERDDAKANNPR